MKYFMVTWQTRDEHNFSGDCDLIDKFQNAPQATSSFYNKRALDDDVVQIAQSCTFLKSALPNMCFFRTTDETLTENAVATWLTQLFGATLCYGRHIYIKQVFDPYPVVQLNL